MIVSVCPLCGAAPARRLYAPLVRCAPCGLVRTEPVPLQVEANMPYEQLYYTERNAYLADEAGFILLFEALLDRIKPYKAAGRLLDVGCGPGLLLQTAQKRGYMVSGCDVSTWATHYARDKGLAVRTGVLESLRYPDQGFDIVVLNHTLEHVPQPLLLLTEIRRILADDGILVVGVPNFASLMAYLLRRRWAGLLPDQHLWHFTPRTLRLMLARAGFSTRRLVVESATHHHHNWVKQAVLRFITLIGRVTRRGEALVVIADKIER